MPSRSALRLLLAAVALLGGAVAGQSSASAAVFASIDAGADHTCAIRPGGAVYCWGTGQYGQLGVIGASRARTPLAVIGSYTATQVTEGNAWGCELRQGGTVACTGSNTSGQLGTGSASPAQFPQDVVGLPSASRIEAGRQTACAITVDGLYCWGDNARGQLGDGNLVYVPTPRPQKVPNVGTVTDVSVGKDHICAVRADKQVLCWGDTVDGKLGNDLRSAITEPGVPVLDLTDATSVVAGERHSCALRQGGTVVCWGNGELGQLGAGGAGPTNRPVAVQGLTGVKQIATMNSTTCALRDDATVWCWGDGRTGELGNGARVSSNVPLQVSGLTGVTAISVGASHACAVTDKLAPYCWGNNRFAQLGSGGLIGAGGVEPTPQIVQDAVRGTASFLPTPIVDRDKTNRGGRVYLRLLRLTRRGSKCPTRAEVTIRARGKEVKRRATDIEKVDGGCAVTALLDLPSNTARAFRVTVVVRGTKLKTRKVSLRVRPSSA